MNKVDDPYYTHLLLKTGVQRLSLVTKTDFPLLGIYTSNNSLFYGRLFALKK